MRLGEYVKELRLNKGLSQKMLAEICELSFVTINHVENQHKAGIKTLNALSNYFEIPIEEFRNKMEKA